MKGNICFLYTITQVHAGKGFDSGVVDLPIQREISTGFPVISGIKGALRNEIKWPDDTEKNIFGAAPKSKEDISGSIAFSEAKIFLFPLRSIEKVFVWITCPLVLSRLSTAFKLTGNEEIPQLIEAILGKYKENKEYSSFDSSSLNIEEYTITTEFMEELNKLIKKLSAISPETYLKDKMENNVVLLSDKDFTFFMKNATEVMARIRINKDTGTADKRALWYEEYLPQDSVMYFITKELTNNNCSKTFEDTADKMFLNLGGKASIGKGFVYLKIYKESTHA